MTCAVRPSGCELSQMASVHMTDVSVLASSSSMDQLNLVGQKELPRIAISVMRSCKILVINRAIFLLGDESLDFSLKSALLGDESLDFSLKSTLLVHWAA